MSQHQSIYRIMCLCCVMGLVLTDQQAYAGNEYTSQPLARWSQGALTTPTPDQFSKQRIKELIRQEARSHPELPVELALAVAKVESDFDATAVSSKGARGVMQIMPATARSVFGLNPDHLWDPVVNIRTGLQYMTDLYRQYDHNWEAALSHYNGGSLKADKNFKPHSYTRSYVANVQRWQRHFAGDAPVQVQGRIQQPIFSPQATAVARGLAEPVSAVDLYAGRSPLELRMQSIRSRFRESLQRWEHSSTYYQD